MGGGQLEGLFGAVPELVDEHNAQPGDLLLGQIAGVRTRDDELAQQG
ncbi:Uncharacterised protein [Mycobacteroides abscessus subsp. massiliense]|nr:Uncharacterised protein [Mycobacteroides abscessus subsp. massiliense]